MCLTALNTHYKNMCVSITNRTPVITLTEEVVACPVVSASGVVA